MVNQKPEKKEDDLIEVEVLRTIGVEYTKDELEKLQQRSRKDVDPRGLTKSVSSGFIMLKRKDAQKLQKINAVRVVI